MQKKLKCLFSSVVFIVLLVNSLNSSAQENNKMDQSAPKNNRWFFGGSLGMQFGSGFDIYTGSYSGTVIQLAPQVGYKFTEKLVGGIGITYEYLGYKNAGLSTNIYGGSIFGRYYFTESLFAHAEYEVLSIEPFYTYYNSVRQAYEIAKEKRTNVESILVGGGYRQPLSDKVSLNIMILWNLNDSYLSPYTNPVIRGGINIGI